MAHCALQRPLCFHPPIFNCGKVGFMLDIRYTFDLFLSVNLYVIAEYSWIMLYLVQITFKNIISKLIIIIFDNVIVLSIWKEKVPTTIPAWARLGTLWYHLAQFSHCTCMNKCKDIFLINICIHVKKRLFKIKKRHELLSRPTYFIHCKP